MAREAEAGTSGGTFEFMEGDLKGSQKTLNKGLTTDEAVTKAAEGTVSRDEGNEKSLRWMGGNKV